MKSEIRKDYIQEKYVIISPRRGKRPGAQFIEHPTHGTVSTKKCVFCPSNLDKEKFLLQVGDSAKGKWQIKVVPNKFPAVSTDNNKAYGVQELVVETPEHEVPLEDLSNDQIAKVLEVYAARTRVISENRRIQYLLIFKNLGGRAGATVRHSHSQIFATEFVPPQLFDKSQRVQAYKLRTGRCVYCDVIGKERKSPRRISDDGLTVAFAPYASMHNYEVWILPARHLDNITDLTDEERLSFARTLKRILQKLKKLGLPYNYYFHQVVRDEDQHLYMKITPRGSVWAGVEIGSGVIINPVPPEDAARFYRM